MSVTYPLGFRAGGIQAGLRTTPGLDLALIVNDGPADVVAGVGVSDVNEWLVTIDLAQPRE